MPARLHPVRYALLTAALGTAAASIALLGAPAASATDGSVFSFPELGTVVVDGTVDDAVNFTVYRILNSDCTGTAFPGPGDSCVPQEATDTLVIPAGTYHDQQFPLSDVPTCGPAQQDVYDGAYQRTVMASGSHQYLAGGIVQLTGCAGTSPTSTPSSPSSSPTKPSSTPSSPSSSPTKPSGTPTSPSSSPSSPSSSPSSPSSAPTTPGQPRSPHASTTPSQPVTSQPATSASTSPSSAVLATGSTVSDTSGAPGVTGYVPAADSNPRGNLASTGAAHTAGLVAAGLSAVALGGAAVAAGRRRPARGH